jgi:hypothetical protein
MSAIPIEVELPPGVTITAYQRYADGHGFEVSWPLPDRCGRENKAYVEFRERVQVIGDLDSWGQPSFWVYQPPFCRCPWRNHRQFLIPPVKRKDTSYTYRFEQQVLRLLIGSSEEEAARCLGISAEMFGLLVRNQLADANAKQVDPQRRILDVSIDERSLKKRHKLYATILTDLTNPD